MIILLLCLWGLTGLFTYYNLGNYSQKTFTQVALVFLCGPVMWFVLFVCIILVLLEGEH